MYENQIKKKKYLSRKMTLIDMMSYEISTELTDTVQWKMNDLRYLTSSSHNMQIPY